MFTSNQKLPLVGDRGSTGPSVGYLRNSWGWLTIGLEWENHQWVYEVRYHVDQGSPYIVIISSSGINAASNALVAAKQWAADNEKSYVWKFDGINILHDQS